MPKNLHGVNQLNKEEFIKYYIVEDHDQIESAKYFNTSKSTIQRFCRLHNITKSPDVDKDSLFDLYVTQNLPVEECAKILHISEQKLYRQLDKYNIAKKDSTAKVANVKKTMINKYGSWNNNREKAKQTLQEIYNVENCSQIPSGKEKRKQTLIDHFGSIDNFYKERSEAIRQTCLDRYGIEYISQTQKFKESLANNMVDKYGSLENFYAERGRQATKSRQGELNDYFIENYYYNKNNSIKYLNNNLSTYYELSINFNVPINVIHNWIDKFGLEEYIKINNSRSSYEDELINLLPSNIDIIKNNREILEGKEIDLYLPQYKLGIEFNGTYWHSNKYLAKNYHIEKSKLAESKGIRLIHIWEYEWVNEIQKQKILSLINIAINNNPTRIYARNCEVKQITNKEAKPFNEANHLQGHRNAQVTYGLYYKGELVQLMSFSKTRYNRNLKNENDWEIIRGCPGSNNIVIGGVSKLFKHFIKDYNPDQIFSYCDFNKFDGKGYEAIGMKFIGYTGPDMKWLIHGKVINRSASKHKEYADQAEAQLWGAGSKKYIWHNNLQLLAH